MLYTAGKPLWRLETRRNTPEGEVRFKSLHYMNNVLARRELTRLEREAGASAFAPRRAVPGEGLLLTAEGWLAEGIVSNLFLSKMGNYIHRISVRAFCRELPEPWCWSWQRKADLNGKRDFTRGTGCLRRTRFL
ncbi:hypothetical protein HMSSN036_61040 [Paenibacillus macerans]|nr:hypothetical protein HMSSN036_61040 [Paenibacillus macerans]